MNLAAAAQLLQGLFDWVWRTSLQATVLIALVSLVQLFSRRVLSARWRYGLWLLVLLRLLMPMVPASAWSVFSLAKTVLPVSTPLGFQPAVSFLPGHSPEPTIGAPRGQPKVQPTTTRPNPWSAAGPVVWLLGLLGSWLVVLRQLRRFSDWARSQSSVCDERIRALLETCQALMGVRERIEIVVAPFLTTPALFGWHKPRLLMPAAILHKLDERELRMVLLHELAHVRRADIVLNWMIIFVRSLHWFNPLVWWAFRRLRADRELVCDAMVLSRLGADERQVYGNTLIKLLDDFSGAGFCPSLAPVINNRTEMKRRVIMIAKYKPAGRVALAVSATLTVALCCVTFTRAAEKQRTTSSDKGAQGPLDAKRKVADNPTETVLEGLKKQLQEMDANVREAQEKVDKLRRDLRISDLVVEGESRADDRNSMIRSPDPVRQLEFERIRVQADYAGQTALLDTLQAIQGAKGNAELRKVILTAAPDELLSRLLQDLSATETAMAKLKVSRGPEDPEMKSLAAMQADLDSKATSRIEGILLGLRVKSKAAQAQIESLKNAAEEARHNDVEMATRYRPYFVAKRQMEDLQRVRDAIQLRILQEQIDAALPKYKPEAQ